jgi:hypothetical protein
MPDLSRTEITWIGFFDVVPELVDGFVEAFQRARTKGLLQRRDPSHIMSAGAD